MSEQQIKPKVKANSTGITLSSAGKGKKFPTVILGMHLVSVNQELASYLENGTEVLYRILDLNSNNIH